MSIIINEDKIIKKWNEYSKYAKIFCNIPNIEKLTYMERIKIMKDIGINMSNTMCILCGVNGGSHLFHPLDYCCCCEIDYIYSDTSIKKGYYDNSYLDFINLIEKEYIENENFEERALAFCMGYHDKLGKNSIIYTINENIIFKNIFNYTNNIDRSCIMRYYYRQRLESMDTNNIYYNYWYNKIKSIEL
jgi:hypothetical protein